MRRSIAGIGVRPVFDDVLHQTWPIKGRLSYWRSPISIHKLAQGSEAHMGMLEVILASN